MIYLSLISLTLQSWHVALDLRSDTSERGLTKHPENIASAAGWSLVFSLAQICAFLLVVIGHLITTWYNHSVLGWSKLRSPHKFHVLQLATSKPFLEGHQSWDMWHEPQVLNVMRACPAHPQSGLWCALGTYQGVAQAMLTPVWLKPYDYSKTFVRLIELEGDCEHRLELEWKMFAQNMV